MQRALLKVVWAQTQRMWMVLWKVLLAGERGGGRRGNVALLSFLAGAAQLIHLLSKSQYGAIFKSQKAAVSLIKTAET